MQEVNNGLRQFVEQNILPLYDAFDSAHQRDHAVRVIDESLRLAQFYDVNIDMVYCAAAYHDIGLCEGREVHHTASARMMRGDQRLMQWFDAEQINTMAEAVEDHRASSAHEPRSIYGRIVAEADRDIEPELIIIRTIQYGLSHYPHLSREQHWQRMLQHLHEKYAEGGYLKLWVPESKNAVKLAELRAIIADERRLRTLFEQLFDAA